MQVTGAEERMVSNPGVFQKFSQIELPEDVTRAIELGKRIIELNYSPRINVVYSFI